jgi:hypothetical protein
MEWQDIETAPRDGRFVLIFDKSALHPGENGVYIARWNDAQDEWDDGAIANPWRYYPEPTHWIPMPELPEEA